MKGSAGLKGSGVFFDHVPGSREICDKSGSKKTPEPFGVAERGPSGKNRSIRA
jgi:hypothetical protein